MLDLSVITISHNHASLLKGCLSSIYSQSSNLSFEMTIIDNACSDDTYRFVSRNYPKIRIIRNKRPKGFSENNNFGIDSSAESRYIMLLNPDVVCLEGLFFNLVNYMDSHPRVGIAGPQLLNLDGSLQPSCRKFSNPLALLVRGLRLDGVLNKSPLIRNYLMMDVDHYNTMEVDWVTGAVMIVRRTAISEVGKLDAKRYFLYSEDQDWCCRMWHNGWSVCYVPRAKAIHRHRREGVKRPWSRATFHQLMSAIKMFHKFGWKIDSYAGRTKYTYR